MGIPPVLKSCQWLPCNSFAGTTMAIPNVPLTNCRNCGTPLTNRFCPSCGQKADTQRITWLWLWHEIQHSIFHVDRGLLFTLKELFTRPGFAIREFLEGKRAGRFKPFATLLIVATVYSLLYRLMPPDLSGVMKENAQLVLLETLNSWMGKYYALMELALLPLFAFSSWLTMRAYGHNFVEHLVIQTYLAAQRICAGIFFLPLSLLGIAAAMLGSSVLSMAYLAGFLFTFTQIYSTRSPVPVLARSALAIALFFSMLMVVALLGAMLLYRLKLIQP